MLERDWLEPYKGKDLFGKENAHLVRLAEFFLSESEHAKKCGCPNCCRLANAASLPFEKEDDRINGKFHEDHEELILTELAWRRLGL